MTAPEKPLADLVAGMTPEERRGALAALDRVSRPMTVREIERALRGRGHSRAWCDRAASALKNLNIIAIHGDIK